MIKEEKTIKLVKKIHELKACNKHLMPIADGNMCIHLAEQCALIAEEYSDQQNAELKEKLAKAEADKQELLSMLNDLNDYFFCEKPLEEGEYYDLINKTQKLIDKCSIKQ